MGLDMGLDMDMDPTDAFRATTMRILREAVGSQGGGVHAQHVPRKRWGPMGGSARTACPQEVA